MILLQTRGLVKSYKLRRVVDGVSLEVNKGEVVGLLGPNGAGKTTSFRMTVGMIRPDAGQVLFKGEDVSKMPMYKRARLGMGYLSQEPSVFQKLTVRENVLAILETLPISHKEQMKRLEEHLDELGLATLSNSKAFMLSGGERRRLEITRALVTSPSLLLLDEPFSGVDPIAVADIQEIVSLLRERGIGILLTDHNVRDTLHITDRAYLIREGKVLDHGTPAEILESKSARQFYLGEKFTMHGLPVRDNSAQEDGKDAES